MQNQSGYKKIYTGFHGAGRDVYVHQAYYEDFEKIFKEYRSDYDMTGIFRQIVSLNANPLQGRGLNPARDMCKTQSGNIYMEYSLYGGAVLIDYLEIRKPVVNKRFGLYPVSWNKKNERWKPANKPAREINKDHQWPSQTGKAHYAAVAGRFDDIESAGDLLFEHVIGAYYKEKFLVDANAQDPYSMFWIRKGQHKSHDAAQALASIMQQTHAADRSVN